MRRSRNIAASFTTTVLCLAMLATMSPATIAARGLSNRPASEAAATPAVPANYDVRNELAAARAGKLALPSTQADAVARMSARVSGLVVHLDEVSLLPKMVTTVTPGQRLSAKGVSDPVVAARRFLSSNLDVYGLKPADLETLHVIYTTSPEGGATIVRFEQRAAGVPVFGAEFAVVMSPVDHAVAGTAGIVYPNAVAGASAKTSALALDDAVARAAGDLSNSVFAGRDFVSKGVDQAGYTLLEFGPDRTAGENARFGEGLRGRQVLFPIAAGETIPSFYVEVNITGEPAGSGPYFAYVISAVDGTVLFRNNLMVNDAFTYRVFADGSNPFKPLDSPQGTVGTPHPTGVPDQYQAPDATTVDVSVESLLGPTDPWLAPGATSTLGNNVDAYLDIAGTDGFTTGDIRGATSAAGQFLYSFDPAAATTDATVRQSKTTHLFFYNNWLHDIWYQKGFNEVSRNAQTDNYGRGGSGSDSIKAEGEDRSGTNNANMSTPADGARPRMQMFRFTGNAANPLTVQRDSSHDWGIVGHEWMHYMSNRLVNNGNGLNNNQGGSMGEGWGDWNALINIVRNGDNIDGVFTTGAWATLQFWSGYFDNYYFGIRRYPYSTRTDIFPLTFKDIGPGLSYPGGVPRNTNIGSSASEVHNSGEIWCEMLWEVSASLIKTYGFDEGRSRAMQYVCDGLKNTPSSPTFGQARDGVITAANAVHPEDVPLVWQAYAKRGIGEGAVSPASGSFNHSGITESFVAPVALPDDTVSLSSGGTYFLRNVQIGGQADTSFAYGTAALTPLAGNWNGGAVVGSDRADTIGAYDPATGAFFLRTSNSPGPADIVFNFGPGGGLKPIAGDWNGDGTTTVGVYDPATGAFFLKNTNASGAADVVLNFGPGGANFVPIAGDWNNDGVDTVGIYDTTTGTFFLKNANTPGPADIVFTFGAGGAFTPVVGDWNDDGTDTIGIYNPSTAVIFLRNSNSSGAADRTYTFGAPGSFVAVAGNFDGQ
ncbi:MAG TPA: M36 family metallopeptidase [Blastocatellia bacterium]|nr:M36 family metallopeptidase [Blastocatellia bacterium]